MGQLPSPSEAHRAGESLDSKGGGVYLLGKAGLTEATSNQTVFIVSLTAPVGCDGTEFMVPWIRVHVRKELSFYLFFFFYRNVLRKATL